MGNAMGLKQQPNSRIKSGPLKKSGGHMQSAKRVSNVRVGSSTTIGNKATVSRLVRKLNSDINNQFQYIRNLPQSDQVIRSHNDFMKRSFKTYKTLDPKKYVLTMNQNFNPDDLASILKDLSNGLHPSKGKKAPTSGLPPYVDASVGVSEYRLGSLVENISKWDGTYRYPGSKLFTQAEVNAKAIFERPWVRARPITTVLGDIPSGPALKIAKGLKTLGYVTAAVGAIDTSSKMYHGNISTAHGTTTIALSVGLLVAGTIASGGTVLVVIAVGFAYSYFEDKIWQDYDRTNAKNYVKPD